MMFLIRFGVTGDSDESAKYETRKNLIMLGSVSDPHKFSCGSRIPKMSIWIRIQTPNFLFGSGSKGGKN